MKPRRAAALETEILLELIAKVKIAVALESGVLRVEVSLRHGHTPADSDYIQSQSPSTRAHEIAD